MKAKLAAVLGLSLCACAPEQERTITGYGEAFYVYASALDGGRIEEMLVEDGQRVEAGQALFRIEPSRNQDSAEAAAASATAARIRSANALADAVRRAEADFALARDALARSRSLFEKGFASEAQLELDQAAFARAQAALEQAKAERSAASLEAKAAAAQASLARRRVSDTDVAAPTDGVVDRIYRRVGEVVAPGDPVVGLIAPENVRVRFFAPQAMLPRLSPGARVTIRCDGCEQPIGARVSFVAHEPQFTPPVIFSEEERDKLVFMVEAIPDDPSAIRPGLPVDVSLAP